MNNLSEYELQLLSKLPLDIAALVKNYRTDIINAAEFWDEPPLTVNHVPEFIEIYYGDAESPHIFIVNGELQDYNVTNLPDNTKSISVLIDDQWAYVQIEGQVILNRLGGVILPDVLVSPSSLINSLVGVINHG
ncbi:hypothetical protein NIES37_68630 [Tolypothrix tenuis PCC 7101]|uniref:Uncharacterized protein n=1 Tax=Tolypothrix tenuis PCC 7101 TaxID=231146 RepID=A0A1Z4NAX1_9CYAN|nr:hypothetical protein [Nostoc linckia FACHB-104]MBD2241220.1 hypothetical protein [Aulosira sp. FACHB-113]BAZ02850.1 hypothetical protein NIES37_68630 [Tolypothrix tenuis PCC 7101]BAZ78256.1 hypothetical protein NIES50_68890 [Aulosira laxa NIES-50]